jgi:hypothetical protein
VYTIQGIGEVRGDVRKKYRGGLRSLSDHYIIWRLLKPNILDEGRPALYNDLVNELIIQDEKKKTEWQKDETIATVIIAYLCYFILMGPFTGIHRFLLRGWSGIIYPLMFVALYVYVFGMAYFFPGDGWPEATPEWVIWATTAPILVGFVGWGFLAIYDLFMIPKWSSEKAAFDSGNDEEPDESDEDADRDDDESDDDESDDEEIEVGSKVGVDHEGEEWHGEIIEFNEDDDEVLIKDDDSGEEYWVPFDALFMD